jgi:FMN phosphatase YigB (HAD superfamily)
MKLAPNDVAVFDLGGVVARFTPQRRMSFLSERTGLTVNEIESRLFASGFDKDAEIGLHDPGGILALICRVLDDRITAEELTVGWALAFELDERLLDWTATLPQRVVLFSNNGPMLLHCCERALLIRINEVFDEQIWSWQLQATKPTPAAFERAALRLAESPENLVLFEDSLACVEQARRSGWRSELVIDPGTLFTK